MAKRAFSLIELMVTLVIICALFLILIPKLLDAQRKAKSAELAANAGSLFRTVRVYSGADDNATLHTGFNPSPQPSAAGVAGAVPRTWNTGVDDAGLAAWGELGWKPDGAVRCSYQATVEPGPDFFWVIGECDVDGDGRPLQSVRIGDGLRKELALGSRVNVFPKNF